MPAFARCWPAAIRTEISPEYLRELVAQVKTMTKGVFAHCPDCRRQVQVSVPDLPRVIAGLTELLEQAEGRPGTASTEAGSVTLIVERTWPSRDPVVHVRVTPTHSRLGRGRAGKRSNRPAMCSTPPSGLHSAATRPMLRVARAGSARAAGSARSVAAVESRRPLQGGTRWRSSSGSPRAG
jgi:hypothetical protein